MKRLYNSMAVLFGATETAIHYERLYLNGYIYRWVSLLCVKYRAKGGAK